MKTIPLLTFSLALVSLGASTARATMFTVIDLGLADGTSTRATGVNNSGTVVGNIFGDTRADGTATTSGFRYSYAGGLMESLRYDTANPDPGSPYGPILHHQRMAYAINNAGQIAGAIDVNGWSAGGAAAASVGPFATVTNPDNSTTFFPVYAPETNLAASSTAYAINASGQIAGLRIPTGTDSSGFTTYENYGTAKGMNDAGTVVGFDGNFKGFVSSGGVTTQIAQPLGGRSDQNFSANDINNNGLIVGTAANASFNRHGFSINAAGVIVDIGLLNFSQSAALAVNDAGQIVGNADYFERIAGRNVVSKHAILYTQETGIMDLNSYFIGTGNMTLTEATAISENGFIAGYGRYADGIDHAFLLVPATLSSSVPDGGGTAALLLLALVVQVAVRRGAATRAVVESR
ncbi:MAG: hypothetical protein NTV51_22355 [Verrucomicrobia bacterium]|nr:hypothetical protein [Verrucomicrobiota bacterium]